MNQYVIIGNGVAAIGCIEGIRSVDKESKITVVSKENHATYCRPLISYYLENKTDLERINYRSEDFYEKMHCDVLYGVTATDIDAKNKRVVLDNSETLPYTQLCIASGASSLIPTFKGLETVKNRFSFMTLDDTLALEKTINKNSKVLIIGAGLIGLKCAEGLRDKVKSITVCDLADRVLSSILDYDCAKIIQKHLEDNGINFMLKDSVAEFRSTCATMQSSKVIDFDILVLAVGTKSNSALIKNIGGEVDRGILVNEQMKTSVQDIYAAGDCTQGEDISRMQKRVLALLPNAYMQGHCAGVNMAGKEEVFDKAIPMNSIGLFGLHIMTAGTYDGEMIEEKNETSLKRFFIKDGFLKGYILIGETSRAGIYTSLIRERTPLDTVDFEILKKVATTFAFSPEIRRKKFGSVV